MVTARPPCLAAATLALVAFLPLPAGDAPTKVYRHREHKFSVKVFPDWVEVPIEVGDPYTCAKWYEPGSRGDHYRPSLEIYRLDRRPKAEITPSGDLSPEEKKKLEIEAAIEARGRPKSLYDLVFGRINVPGGQKGCDPATFKKIKSNDSVEGKLWTTGDNPKERTAEVFVGLVAFEKEGVEYGILLSGAARRRDDFGDGLKAIARSFIFFDKNVKEVQSIDVLDGVNITPRRRNQIEKGLIKGWGVEVSPKKNYVIVYNTKGNKNRALALFIAERIERIRSQVYEVQFPPSQPVTAVSIVRICGDRNEYHAYGGPGGSAGYWNDDSEELVFYDASPAKKVDDDTLAVLYHEAFHQYIYYSVGNVAPHSWFNEGHGDYYAGSKYANSKFKIAPFNWRVGTIKSAITQGRRSFTVKKDEKTGKERRIYSNDKGYTPLKDLVAFSQGEYYSYPGVCYAQGWSLIYFLREGVPKKKEWNAKWGQILDRYFAALKREVEKEGKLQRGGVGPEPPGPEEPPVPNEPTGPVDPPEPPRPNEPDTPPADPPKEPEDPAPGEGEGEEADEPPQDPGLQPMQEGYVSESALETALREAFSGVDFDELEAAWVEFTKKVR